MASYGDIVEIDGQFFEFTPVGYMPVSTGGMLTDPVFDSGLEQPPFEEVEEQDTLRDRLEGMLGGIGQSELGAIWADPTMVEILTANSIRMNPDAPYDIGQATGVTADALAELITFIQEIAEAGGYEEWLAQQPTGDPGDLEPPPAPEPEPEEETEVTQVPISEADFNEQFPDVDPSEYTESGTWTDPETGIVYVINIPPPVETEEEEGGGGEEAPTDAEGEPTTDQPAEEEVIVDPSDSTVDDEDAETAETIPTDTTETGEEDSSEIDPGFEDDRNYYDPNTEYQVGDIVNDVFGREWVYLPDPTRPGRDRWVITNPDDELIREYEQATGRTYEEDMNGVAVYGDPTGSLEDDPNYVFDTEEGEEEDSGLEVPTREPDIIFDPTRTPDFPGGPAPIPEQEPEQPTEPTTPAEPTTPTEPTEPTTPTEPVPPAEEVPETPTEPTPPAEEPEQPTEETEPTPPTEQPTEQPTPTEEAPETPEQPGTETPSDTPTTGTDETGTAGEGEGDGTGTGTGTGTGEGEGEGDGTGTGERRDGLFDDYQEFMTSIGYQPVQLQQLIAPPKKDYFRELDNLIGRSLFGKMI